MRKFSKKRAAQNREYLKVRYAYLMTSDHCAARVTGCTLTATQIHHKRGRIGELLCDTSYFLPVCMNCHEWIEKHPQLAKELGFSESRLYVT